MQFVHQSLTWGFMLAMIPVLIHLINLVRRRRVQWAAMDFLLQSYRKHRTWIWLQQLLLLLLRMFAIALVVAMLAQWITQKEWLSMFGGTETHHYILLDDSYSMGERFAGTTSFDLAEQAILNLASQAMQQETGQKFTLIRYSRAETAGPELSAGQIADLNSEIVDRDFDVFVSQNLLDFGVTEFAVGPQAGLSLIQQLLDEGLEDRHVVYVLSDFRRRDWDNPAELQQQLQAVSRAGAEVHLVNCAEQTQENLSLSLVRPAEETRAAGVPLFIDLQVKNHGQQTARKVPVRVRTYFYDPALVTASRPGADVARADDPPAALIEEILPGETAAARVQVFFPQPGAHVVEAELPDDVLAEDNRRWAVVDLPESEPVLLIDGSVEQRHAYYVAAAFDPGERASTGIQPDIKQASFLRDVTLETLRQYRVVYLLDVPRLDTTAVETLTQFVAEGGGLGIFLGENVSSAFYNESLYRDGEGLFPLALERPVDLPPERFENVPDLEVSNHPVFSVFLGERNPFIRLVAVNRFWQSPGDIPAANSVLAKLRNGEPLAVERRFGDGRVVAFLTSAAPAWNNWGNDPSFVVMMLKLHSYLAAPTRRVERRLVGSPIDVQLDTIQFAPEVTFVTPGDGVAAPRAVIEQTATLETPDGELASTRLGDARALSDVTSRSGTYEAWLRRIAGPAEVRRYALNVDPLEGNLAHATAADIQQRLEPVRVEYHEAADFAYGFFDEAGANRSLLLMGLLVLALVCEQLLAYFTSYHPARGVAG